MPFEFLDPGSLADDQLQLHLLMTEITHDQFWTTPTPTYRFEVQQLDTGTRLGNINLRIGDWKLLKYYTGNIGYGIDETHRGNHFAERACRILLPFAAANGLKPVWITCAPDNLASRRTIERLERNMWRRLMCRLTIRWQMESSGRSAGIGFEDEIQTEPRTQGTPGVSGGRQMTRFAVPRLLREYPSCAALFGGNVLSDLIWILAVRRLQIDFFRFDTILQPPQIKPRRIIRVRIQRPIQCIAHGNSFRLKRNVIS